MILPGESEKYLGLKVDPWTGFSNPLLSEKLNMWLERLKKAPLKPSQKLTMLNVYTVPRIIYMADHTETKKSLSSLDNNIRNMVKQWLHLPVDTCNGFIYARTRDVTKLSSLIPSIQARWLHRIAYSDDTTIKNITLINNIEEEYQNLWKIAGGKEDKTPKITIQYSLTIDCLSIHWNVSMNGKNQPQGRYIQPHVIGGKSNSLIGKTCLVKEVE